MDPQEARKNVGVNAKHFLARDPNRKRHKIGVSIHVQK
jgi:hypothetical protein